MRRLTDDRRALAGSPEALQLAAAVAGRYAGRFPALWDDLHAAARLGLVDAAGRFDPARGLKFSTFAMPRILGAVRDCLRAHMPKGYRRTGAGGVTVMGFSEVLACDPVAAEFDPPSGELPVGWEEEAADEVRGLCRQVPAKQGEVLVAYFTRAGASRESLAAEAGLSGRCAGQRFEDGLRRLRAKLAGAA